MFRRPRNNNLPLIKATGDSDMIINVLLEASHSLDIIYDFPFMSIVIPCSRIILHHVGNSPYLELAQNQSLQERRAPLQ